MPHIIVLNDGSWASVDNAMIFKVDDEIIDLPNMEADEVANVLCFGVADGMAGVEYLGAIEVHDKFGPYFQRPLDHPKADVRVDLTTGNTYKAPTVKI